MHPAAKRLQNLKEMLKVEQSLKNPNQPFIDDLKLSIRQAERDVKNATAAGFVMVE